MYDPAGYYSSPTAYVSYETTRSPMGVPPGGQATMLGPKQAAAAPLVLQGHAGLCTGGTRRVRDGFSAPPPRLGHVSHATATEVSGAACCAARYWSRALAT